MAEVLPPTAPVELALPAHISPPPTVDSTTPQDTADATLSTLQTRLRRIEYLLAGTSPTALSTHRDASVRSQLNTLLLELQGLKKKSRTVAEMLAIHQNHPTLFSTIPAASVPAPIIDDIPTTTKLTLLSNSLPLFQTTSSQLSAISDTPIPSPALSASLVNLLPRLQRLEVLQAAQEKRIAELRARSARVLEEWYLVGVEGVNECFAEWDQRLERTEREVNRRRGVEEEVLGDDGDEERQEDMQTEVESKKEEKEDEAVLGDQEEEETKEQETHETAAAVVQEEAVLGDDSEDEEPVQETTAAPAEKAVLGDE
ncbi:hypothetical protein BZA77DRAFT_309434 [Pyronema omphalodes]|nr:hypothetical protein BZA77DRAFT_309434 [Pyronema omphalodes]